MAGEAPSDNDLCARGAWRVRVTDAAANGPYDFVLDAVSSADARDKAASYYEKIRTLDPPIITSGRTADKHNYVVLGGATKHWGVALLKRFCKLNAFAKGFELFWIQMPGSKGVLQQLAAFADAPADAGTLPLKPKLDTRLEFSEASARQAFDLQRGRRTAGKIVMEMTDAEPAAAPVTVAVT